MADPRRILGAAGERIADHYLSERGHLVVARNARTRRGEIDLVTLDGRTLVFVEVKTARMPRNGDPLDPLLSVDHHKQTRVRLLAREWLAGAAKLAGYEQIRFDVVGVVIDPVSNRARVEHIEAAF